ncbi:hypothetical protein MMC29_001243 [Sticta canariensis]|nr:hypothetical protein [Sticta canariensis]
MAALPLVIEGLRLYFNGIERIKIWWRYAKVLKHLIRKLEMEKMKFENTCTELLYDLVGERELELLLENPGGHRWRQKCLQARLRGRLGPSFNVFLEAVVDMSEIVKSFKEKLDLDDDDKPKWIDYKYHKREWKRVRFSLSDKENESLIQDMEKDNRDLGDLLGHRQRMETMTIPKFTTTAKRYECIGDHASSLYQVLRKSLTWPCGCSIPHNASLRLEARTSREPDPTHEEYSDLCFNVLFFFDTNPSISQILPPWNWRETRIEPINDTNSQEKSIVNEPGFTGPAQIQAAASFATAKNTTISTLARTAVPSFSFTVDSFSIQSQSQARNIASSVHPETATTQLNLSSQAVRRKKVSFAPSDLLAVKISTSSVQSQQVERSLPVSEKIDCLCTAMQKVNGTSCLGVLVDDLERQHRISITDTSVGRDPLQTVSLKALFAQTALEKKDRLILGIKLASTLLQLHRTPWLKETWGKSDILFMKECSGTQMVLVQKPFLSKPFIPPTCTLPRRPTDESSPSPEVRNKSIFALGILLIELWFGQPLEDLRKPEDFGSHSQVNHVTDFATARRLSEIIYREAGDWYGDAVRRCIYCEFDQRHNSLDSQALKEAVHRGVVTPLEKNLTSFCGGKLEGLLA